MTGTSYRWQVEVLDTGPDRPEGRRGNVLKVAAIAVVVAGAGLWWTLSQAASSGEEAANRPPASSTVSAPPTTSTPATSTPATSPTSTPGSVGGSPAPWPSASGACGSVAWLPVAHLGRGEPPSLRLLVGGPTLSVVDIVDGLSQVRPLSTGGRAGAVVDLLRGEESGASYAVVSDGCAATSLSLFSVSADLSVRSQRVDPADGTWLIPGPNGPWQVQQPQLQEEQTQGTAQLRVRLHEVATGATTDLDEDLQPVAVMPDGVLAARGGAANGNPGVELWSTRGRLVRDLGQGWPYGVAVDGTIMVGNDCIWGAAAPCRLRRVAASTGAEVGHVDLPTGRVLTSEMVFDPGSRTAAFLLAKASPETLYDTGHPFPPSEIAVLDLATGRLDVVPGLELAPKSDAALALTRDGWVLAALNEGVRARIVAWRRGLPDAVLAATVPGPLIQAPPVRVLAQD